MRQIGETPRRFYSFNTCEHQGRIFNVCSENRWLVIYEIVLGPTAEVHRLLTGVNIPAADDNWYTACCSMGERLLVMSGAKGSVFAALLDIGAGPLSKDRVSITRLNVVGDIFWSTNPYLCKLTESRVLLTFSWSDGAWSCYLNGSSLKFTKYQTKLPFASGFLTLPLPLSGCEVLAVGGHPDSRNISCVTVGVSLSFVVIGNAPSPPRHNSSGVLLGGRFLVGFGGVSGKNILDTLWLFDLSTRRAFQIGQLGCWHPRDCLVPMFIRDDMLYLLGGECSNQMHSFPLVALRFFVPDPAVERDLAAILALPQYSPEHKKCQLEVESLRAALQEKDNEIQQLKETIEGMKTELQWAQSHQRSSTSIPLPTINISAPLLSLPKLWRWNKPRFETLLTAWKIHRDNLPHESAFLKAYELRFASTAKKSVLRLALRAAEGALDLRMAMFYLQELTTSVSPVSRQDSPPMSQKPRCEGLFIRMLTKEVVSNHPASLAYFHALPLLKCRDSEAAMSYSKQKGLLAEGLTKTEADLAMHVPPVVPTVSRVVESFDPFCLDALLCCASELRRQRRIWRKVRAVQKKTSFGDLSAPILQLQAIQKEISISSPKLWEEEYGPAASED